MPPIDLSSLNEWLNEVLHAGRLFVQLVETSGVHDCSLVDRVLVRSDLDLDQLDLFGFTLDPLVAAPDAGPATDAMGGLGGVMDCAGDLVSEALPLQLTLPPALLCMEGWCTSGEKRRLASNLASSSRRSPASRAGSGSEC